MYKKDDAFIIKPEDIRKEAIAAGSLPEALQIPGSIILTFNCGIIEKLKETCGLHDWDWPLGKHSPYVSPRKCWKGTAHDHGVCVFVPPMGASPIAAFCEELVCLGANTIFLLCASWGLGEKYLKKGQIHLPSFAVGHDGTSFHYGPGEIKVRAEPKSFNALSCALDKLGADWKQGGVGCCEAFYRITPKMVNDYRKQGCLSMENGEVAVLYSLAKVYKINVGVLLQPYIDLEHGWDPSFMDDTYKVACHLQAHVAIEALEML
jgi:uridine phosphorylase